MDTAIFFTLFHVVITSVIGSAEVKVKIIEVSEDVGCSSAITLCQQTHTQLGFGGLPKNVFSPDDLMKKCSSTEYADCVQSIDKASCTDEQNLDIQGSSLAEEYVCSEEGLNQYKQGNEYTDNPWRPLQKYYIVDEDQMCLDKFYTPARAYMADYQVLEQKLEDLPESKNAGKELDLIAQSKEQRELYCHYMYSYQTCVEQAAKRHCNDTISIWQQKVTELYFTPHFEQMKCHIGSGLNQVTINAIVIASLILLSIFGLAFFCGVYEKCGEKLSKCRRSKNKDDGDNGSQRESIVYPDKNGGMPQRTGSRVRFDIDC